MQKVYIRLLFLLFSFAAIAVKAQQSNATDTQIKPLKFSTQTKNKEYQKSAKTQNRLKTIESQSVISSEESISSSFDLNSPSALSYLNSYNQLRNSYLQNDGFISNNENSELDKIANESFVKTNGSFESYYLLLRQNRNNKNAYKYLREANLLSPYNTLLYLEQAWQAERIRNLEVRDKALKTAYNIGKISKLLVETTSWICTSAKPNSLIITNGEFDTYPMWYNQIKYKNIKVISLDMIEDYEYLTNVLKDWDSSLKLDKESSKEEIINTILRSKEPKYFTWTVNPTLLRSKKDFLYPVGAMIAYSYDPLTNISELKSFYMNKKVVNYVSSMTWVKDEFAPIMKNFIPGIDILLGSNSLNETEVKSLKELKNKIIRGLNQNSSSNGK